MKGCSVYIASFLMFLETHAVEVIDEEIAISSCNAQDSEKVQETDESVATVLDYSMFYSEEKQPTEVSTELSEAMKEHNRETVRVLEECSKRIDKIQVKYRSELESIWNSYWDKGLNIPYGTEEQNSSSEEKRISEEKAAAELQDKEMGDSQHFEEQRISEEKAAAELRDKEMGDLQNFFEWCENYDALMSKVDNSKKPIWIDNFRRAIQARERYKKNEITLDQYKAEKLPAETLVLELNYFQHQEYCAELDQQIQNAKDNKDLTAELEAHGRELNNLWEQYRSGEITFNQYTVKAAEIADYRILCASIRQNILKINDDKHCPEELVIENDNCKRYLEALLVKTEKTWSLYAEDEIRFEQFRANCHGLASKAQLTVDYKKLLDSAKEEMKEADNDVRSVLDKYLTSIAKQWHLYKNKKISLASYNRGIQDADFRKTLGIIKCEIKRCKNRGTSTANWIASRTMISDAWGEYEEDKIDYCEYLSRKRLIDMQIFSALYERQILKQARENQLSVLQQATNKQFYTLPSFTNI